ncbi:MAG: DUF3696 domain-containing protein [Gammaproteobacteria bacterium]
MRLRNISLRNFKSVGSERQTIDLAPITLLFGPNSAGKSTVLHALLFLREVVAHRNLDPDKTELGGEFIDLGGFLNLVHGRGHSQEISKSEMEIGIGIDHVDGNLADYLSETEKALIEEAGYASPSESWFLEIESLEVSLTISWSELVDRPVVRAYQISINDEFIGRITSNENGKQIEIDEINFQHELFITSGQDDPENYFADLCNQLFDTTRLTLGGTTLDAIAANPRPLSRYSIDELEGFLDTWAYHPKAIDIVLDELQYRTSKRSIVLGTRLGSILFGDEKAPNLPTESFGLLGQKDALVSLATPLELDQLTKEKIDNNEEIDRALPIFLNSVINGIFVSPLDELAEMLAQLTYIGPLRDLPPRTWTPQRSPDKKRWAKGLAAWELLHTADTKLVDKLNRWLGDRHLNSGYEIALKRYREVWEGHPTDTYLKEQLSDNELEELEDEHSFAKESYASLPLKTRVNLVSTDSYIEVNTQDIGIGISQLLPVLVACSYRNSGTISIEQPELHLHPKLQVELGDFFIENSVEDGKVFILETHSEHLLLRILRRIREHYSYEDSMKSEWAISNDQVSVIYVQTVDGAAQYLKQEITEDGDFVNDWPEGFFDERAEELF